MIATGIGSMPGQDIAESLQIVVDTVPDLPYLPELPARGAPATMVGRGVAILDGLYVDLQPAGWRLTDGPGIDQRRARSRLSQDLDVLEEELQGFDGTLKIQVPGPLTLASTVERPKGDRILADHGARRELAQSLASGLGEHVADVRRRVQRAEVIVQVDEPAVRAVLDAQVPTASGWGRHRRVDETEAERSWAVLVEAVTAQGGRPVVHTCAERVPVALFAKAGFTALSLDRSLITTSQYDELAAAFEDGLDLWPGVVPTTGPEAGPGSDRELVVSVQTLFTALGFDEDSFTGRTVLTPTCGLASASPTWAREALRLARTAAGASS